MKMVRVVNSHRLNSRLDFSLQVLGLGWIDLVTRLSLFARVIFLLRIGRWSVWIGFGFLATPNPGNWCLLNFLSHMMHILDIKIMHWIDTNLPIAMTVTIHSYLGPMDKLLACSVALTNISYTHKTS